LLPIYVQSTLALSTSCFIVVTLRLQPRSKLQTNVWKWLPQFTDTCYIWCQTNTLLWEVIIDWLIDNFIELKYYSVVLECSVVFTVFNNSVAWLCTTVNAWNVWALQIKEYWNLERMQCLLITYVICYNQKYMKGHFQHTLFLAVMDSKWQSWECPRHLHSKNWLYSIPVMLANIWNYKAQTFLMFCYKIIKNCNSSIYARFL